LASKNAGFLNHFRGVPAVSTQKKIDWTDGSSIRMVSIWHHQSSCVIVAHNISLGPSICIATRGDQLYTTFSLWQFHIWKPRPT
jgi:hypothetical protein